MKKNYSFEGSYQINNSDEKNFVINYENDISNHENNSKLLALLDSPRKLLSEGGKLGVSGIKRFFSVFFLFAFSNTVLFFYAAFRLITGEFAFGKTPYLLLILAVGIAFTVLAAYRAYRFVLIDTLRVIYSNLSSFFQKISSLTVDKVDHLMQGKVNFSDEQLKQALDFGKLLDSKFQKIPLFLRRGILLILNRIPFLGMVLGLKEDIQAGKKNEASEKLYLQMDSFITNSIFGNNNTRWLRWLLPLNIVGILALIEFFLS